jgi:hypothetical protein
MPEEVEIAQSISIREAGFDEYWLQDQIAENPACLGLGELEAIAKERQQSSGGRLDILLKNPEDDSMYEVEVMLGETDETHIIRTIEYWDNEKRKWPQRQHFAVLVAEHIDRRFFNVVHLLSYSIPIIAIQVSMLAANGKKTLFLTKVLDTFEEISKIAPIRLVGGASIWALQARAERSRVGSQIRSVWHRTHRTPWLWPSRAHWPPHTQTCR